MQGGLAQEAPERHHTEDAGMPNSTPQMKCYTATFDRNGLPVVRESEA